jgi:hypothetical protein
MRRIKLTQMGAVIAVCALVGAIAGIAGSAAAPSKKKSGRAAGSAQPQLRFHDHGPGPRHPGGPGDIGVHYESVVLNKAGDGFITVTSDAGEVKSVDGGDVTIDESVGTVHYKDVKVTIPGDATIVRNHDDAKLSDIEAGDFVRVIASSEQTLVIAEDAAFLKRERRHFGRRGPWRHGAIAPGAPAPPPAPAPYGA